MKKKTKKTIGIIIVSIILLITITVFCIVLFSSIGSKNNSKDNNNDDSSGSNTSSKELSVKDLSIDDFKFEYYSSMCDSQECYAATLTNNSKFIITGVNFYYRVKSGVSEDELSVYNDFMQYNKGDMLEDYIKKLGYDYSLKNITLISPFYLYLRKGEQDSIHFYIGVMDETLMTHYANEEQFKLMEPRELDLSLIYNGKEYYVRYDFDKKTWKIDEETRDVDVWSNTDIAKALPKPKGEHFVVHRNEDSLYFITSYGIDKYMYEEYIKTLKEAGFKESIYTSDYYSGVGNGYSVTVEYADNYEKSGWMSIEIRAES